MEIFAFPPVRLGRYESENKLGHLFWRIYSVDRWAFDRIEVYGHIEIAQNGVLSSLFVQALFLCAAGWDLSISKLRNTSPLASCLRNHHSTTARLNFPLHSNYDSTARWWSFQFSELILINFQIAKYPATNGCEKLAHHHVSLTFHQTTVGSFGPIPNAKPSQLMLPSPFRARMRET